MIPLYPHGIILPPSLGSTAPPEVVAATGAEPQHGSQHVDHIGGAAALWGEAVQYFRPLLVVIDE